MKAHFACVSPLFQSVVIPNPDYDVLGATLGMAAVGKRVDDVP